MERNSQDDTPHFCIETKLTKSQAFFKSIVKLFFPWLNSSRPTPVMFIVKLISVVGLSVGTYVGTRVGETVGGRVGQTVGVLVGTCVGSSVGLCVGNSVGVTVGGLAGSKVGFVVGPTVGKTVGVYVGVSVSATVGIQVGMAVGKTVGTLYKKLHFQKQIISVKLMKNTFFFWKSFISPRTDEPSLIFAWKNAKK